LLDTGALQRRAEAQKVHLGASVLGARQGLQQARHGIDDGSSGQFRAGRR
jgi:hypothetical protein